MEDLYDQYEANYNNSLKNVDSIINDWNFDFDDELDLDF